MAPKKNNIYVVNIDKWVGILIQNFEPNFRSYFLPILGRLCLGVPKEKIIGSHHFSFLLSTNTPPINFLSYFPLPFFHYLQTHPNLTYNLGTGRKFYPLILSHKNNLIETARYIGAQSHRDYSQAQVYAKLIFKCR